MLPFPNREVLHRFGGFKLRLTNKIKYYAVIALIITILPSILCASSDVSNDNFLPVSKLKRGMQGYGLTVFQGTKIEKFYFKILGIQKTANTGKDFIVVRIGGGPITARQTGIIAGMSGSPCYIGGKLVGALSYGMAFSKEPIGMITPINDMLEAWNERLPSKPAGMQMAFNLSEPLLIKGAKVSSVSVDDPGAGLVGINSGVMHMQPLMTPVMISGVSMRGISRLTETLMPFGLQPLAIPSGKSSVKVDSNLKPGAAMGISLAYGDIDMTAVGTVTYRQGNKIVGFGHPMLGIGSVDTPLTTAYVIDVISSLATSTKLADPDKMVGRIFQDRPWSVAGVLGSLPKTIPLNVIVKNNISGNFKNYKIQVLNHPILTSRLITSLVGEAISLQSPAPMDTTAKVSYEINTDKLGKIQRSNIFFNSQSVDEDVSSDIGPLLQMLSFNRFDPVAIKSVKVTVSLSGKRNTGRVEKIFVKKNEFEPGETAQVGVVFRPYKGSLYTKYYDIQIPASAADGKVILLVRGGGQQGGPVIALAPGDGADEASGIQATSGDVSSGSAESASQLIKKYLEKEKNNQLVLRIVLRSAAVSVAGEKFYGYPGYLTDAMKSPLSSGFKMELDEAKKVYDTDSIIGGMSMLMLNIKQKNGVKSGLKMPEIQPVDATVETVSTVDYSKDSSNYFAAQAGEETIASEEDADDDIDQIDTPAKPEEKAEVTTDEKKPSQPAKPAETISDAKTVVRKAKIWQQKGKADFSKGIFNSTSVNNEEKLIITNKLELSSELTDPYVWCFASAPDGIYAGTGNTGKIYNIKSDGTNNVFFDTDELEVHSLVLDSKGNLYASTSPNGKIFKISPQGKGELYAELPNKYALSLVIDTSDNLYACAGDAGKVYEISNGKVIKDFTLNDSQVTCLALAQDGSILAGTGINGIIYKIDSAGSIIPIFQAAGGAITSIVSDSAGNIYAAVQPKGIIYKISPDGREQEIVPKTTKPMSLTADSLDNIYVACDGSIIKISKTGTYENIDTGSDKPKFISIYADNKTGMLYGGTGGLGNIYRGNLKSTQGVFESDVFDSSDISKWGAISSSVFMPTGAKTQVQTRTGNISKPDLSWSDWSSATDGVFNNPISNPSGRYIQYKLTLSSNENGLSPEVSGVSSSYLPTNSKPVVKITAPAIGEILSGTEIIKWQGTDPDSDTLSYSVYYSSDNATTWQVLMGDMSDKKIDESKILGKIKFELEKSKDVPDSIKKEVLKGKEAESSSDKLKKSSDSTFYNWDTKAVADGTYILKITVSDKTSNADFLTGEVISQPFIVCNAAPKVILDANSVKISEDGEAIFNGRAETSLTYIIGVQYRIDGGAWFASAAVDGMFDSSNESFSVKTDKLKLGGHKIEVQAIDCAGNAKIEKLDIKR